MTKPIFSFLFCFIAMMNIAQNPNSELRFIEYLITSENFKEAESLLDFSIENAQHNDIDSLWYLKGKTAFLQQKLQISSESFEKIIQPSMFGDELFFYQMMNGIALKKHEKFDLEKSFEDEKNDLYLLNIAGQHLLKKDFQSFESITPPTHFKVASEFAKLQLIKNEYIDRKWKSPLAAGLMSAVVPGAGKWYAGKKGEALSSFFQVGTTGYLAYENWRNGGFRNPQFYIFAAMFSAYYFGNIYGSVMSIHTENLFFNNQYEKAIIFNLRFALRNFFD